MQALLVRMIPINRGRIRDHCKSLHVLLSLNLEKIDSVSMLTVSALLINKPWVSGYLQ